MRTPSSLTATTLTGQFIEPRLCTPELKDAFHKLKGTGKTYGLPEISELAAVVEEACLLDPGAGRRQAERALPLLRDIARTRHAGQAFVLTTDERWVALRSAA